MRDFKKYYAVFCERVDNKKTYKEIADNFSLTKERVRQMILFCKRFLKRKLFNEANQKTE